MDHTQTTIPQMMAAPGIPGADHRADSAHTRAGSPRTLGLPGR